MPVIQVTRTLTRNYGSYTSSWSVGYEVEIGSRADLLREYGKCDEHLHAAMLDFETHGLKALPATSGKSIASDQKGVGETKRQWVKAIGITKSVDKGKTYYKVVTVPGTKWHKFGAPLYWDNFTGMTELEFKARADDEGQHVLPDDFHVCIVSQPGKADKAVGIAHKDMIEL